MKICVCDKNQRSVSEIEGKIRAYLEKNILHLELICMRSSEELLSSNCKDIDLLILSTEFEDINGIDVARKFRTKNATCEIIFISEDPLKARYAFEVDALRYLMKPVNDDELDEALDIAISRIEHRASKLLKLKQGQRVLQLQIDDIIYFETLDRKLKVNTKDKVYLVDNKINDLEKRLENQGFFRIHKSYLINLALIKEYDQNSVTMQNGEIAYISRLKSKIFKTQYQSYIESKYNQEINEQECYL